MKTILFFVALYISLSATSQDWIEFTASESIKPYFIILGSNDTIVEFEVTVPGMFSAAVDSFNRIQIKEQIRMDSVRYPELPVINYLVAIPDCDSVIVNIEILA